MRLGKWLDAAADTDTKLKMTAIVFMLAVIPAGVCLLLLNKYPSDEMTAYFGLYLVVLIIIHVPLSHFFSEILALRNIKKVNAYCGQAKLGVYRISFDLPPEKGEEHDFIRMKRNLYWMGQIIAERETKLMDALRDLKAAQAQIVESMEYAALIQYAMLPPSRLLEALFEDYFIWWEPRDMVGGDTYWVTRSGEGYFVGVIDCTGHGVPGAFLTLIVHTLLEKIADSGDWNDPARVLQYLNRRLRTFFARNGTVDDGLDAAICFVDTNRHELLFAGASRPMLYSWRGKIHEIKGDRCGVGYARVAEGVTYTRHTVHIEPGMRFYLVTDGLTDQIGGDRNFPFGRKRLKDLLSQTASLPFEEQREVLREALEAYTGRQNRRDDLTLLGFCPGWAGRRT
jgi:serine phosphatase RsbU (regulator of sigma subunit)